MEQKPEPLVKTFWNSTGPWRLIYFDQLKSRDPRSLSPALRAEREFVISEEEEISTLFPNARFIVELGCGVGRSLFKFIKLWPKSNFVGVDFASLQIKLFREVVIQNGWRNALPIVADVGELPLASSSFDLALILNQTFGNFLGGKRDACLRETSRILRLGGELFIGGFSKISLARACYQEWNVRVVSIDEATGLVELEQYRSWWAPEHQIISFAESYGFKLIRRRLISIGYLHVYRKILE